MAVPADLVVGIDVAKQRLDVAVHPTAATWTVPRTRGGLRRLRADLTALQPTRIVLEATGGYERAVAAALPGLPVVVVNPRQTRNLARAHGTLAKADRIAAGAVGWAGRDAITTQTSVEVVPSVGTGMVDVQPASAPLTSTPSTNGGRCWQPTIHGPS